MISANTYQVARSSKKAAVFALAMKDLDYQLKKRFEAETNPKKLILKEYYNSLVVFSKKNSDALPYYQK